MTASGSTSSPSLACSGSSAGASTVVVVVVAALVLHSTSCPLISLNAAAWRSLLPVAVAAMNPLRVAADSMLPIADVSTPPRAVL